MHGEPDTEAMRRALGAEALSVATSEDDLADAWWRMLARGMHRVGCVRARYRADQRRLEPMGHLMRLSG